MWGGSLTYRLGVGPQVGFFTNVTPYQENGTRVALLWFSLSVCVRETRDPRMNPFTGHRVRLFTVHKVLSHLLSRHWSLPLAGEGG